MGQALLTKHGISFFVVALGPSLSHAGVTGHVTAVRSFERPVWLFACIHIDHAVPAHTLCSHRYFDHLLCQPMRSKFKDEHPFDKRKQEAERIRQKYPDRIPVICEKADRTDIPTIDKKKYLVPSDLTVGQFVYVIRKRIKLPPEKAIFIFVDEVLPPTAALMSAIYEEHKDEDNFLYVSYSGENTFGEEGWIEM